MVDYVGVIGATNSILVAEVTAPTSLNKVGAVG